MICPACNEEFVAANENDDLCPECMELLREGGQEVILGKYDTAIVLRSKDGETYTKEILIQQLDDKDTIVNTVSLFTVRFALGMEDQQVIDRCDELMTLTLEIVKKVEKDIDSPKKHQLGQ